MAAVLALLWPSWWAATAEPLTVRVKGPESDTDVRDDYFRDVLDLALSETEGHDGPYRIVVGVPANQGRALAQLRAGSIDVVWTVPDEAREREFASVHVPLERGLLGYRVLLVRAEEVARFAAIDGPAALQRLRIGQGFDWNATAVLKANNIPVVEMSDYDALFSALRRGAIDAFPRGLNEAWAELAQRPGAGLVVEPGLLIRYPATSFFYVRRDRAALAGRLERGLRAALGDGRFDALLLGHPSIAAMLRLANLGTRRVLQLRNPLLPASVPVDDPALWSLPGPPSAPPAAAAPIR